VSERTEIEAAAAPPGRQPGHPNLMAGGWKPGQSGNPAGLNRYQKLIRDAIQKQETPERVCAVVAAMQQDACAHEKYSAAAAKVYFEAVGLPRVEATKVDLSDAPPEVMNYLSGKLQ
jgi:hypothetical protein